MAALSLINLKKKTKSFLAYGRATIAVHLIERYLVKHPWSGQARAALAENYRKIGKMHKAAVQSFIATELNPENLQAHLEAFNNCCLLGDLESAMQHIAALSESALPQAPKGVSLLARLLITYFNKATPARFINVGGGPDFIFPYWRNLEAIEGPLNPEGFQLSPDSVFPEEDRTIHLVYSSHCLEHLDDATVSQVLSEARRVLKPTGSLVIKIPDFDQVLASLASSNSQFFTDPCWNVDSIRPTWSNRKVEDTLYTRAASLFCGFWNQEYGDAKAHFGNSGKITGKAYHGPPPLSQSEFRNIFASTSSPHEIAAYLRKVVMNTEPSFSFNHQNAWSRTEMESVLKENGFRLLSTDAEKISKRYAFIPGIRQMYKQSAYSLAVPN